MANTAPSEPYDGILQMFVEAPRDPDPARLGFLRWLVENGRLEPGAAGPSTGELAKLTPFEPKDELSLASWTLGGRAGRERPWPGVGRSPREPR